MELTQAIIKGMKAEQLRNAVRRLDVPVDSYREKQSLARGLSDARATP